MKRRYLYLLAILATMTLTAGCTRITSCQPLSGPPGQSVYLSACGMFGDPAEQSLKWDGKVIRDPFPGSFTVPAIDQGGTVGKHKITLVDKLDVNEAFLIFPVFRTRRHTVTFRVTAP